ncbi:hypothetical protein ZIOFF_057060 [Zingiber officinale]|uniref:WRKY domain-containing protein n=1 Tax=Zingiber officinale TaxID=94328 RepID=A0A8J5KT18_ZINOF|nr:hypothetical protein ZIOFF_057060 [Zingiber officinale]
MEEVEKASRAAVESCHRVLSLLSRPQDQAQSGNLLSETGDAIAGFRKVISLLGKSSGHGRIRVGNKVASTSNHKLLLDHQLLPKMDHTSNPPQLQREILEAKIQVLDSSARNPFRASQRSFLENQLNQQALSPSEHQFLQHQPQHDPRFRFPQKMNHQADMFQRSNCIINFKFEGSSHMPSTSTTRSFLSSLSMNGSAASMDGKSFHLIGGPVSSDLMNLHHPPKRRCVCIGEDGNGKCATTGRCHCSKRRKLRIKRSIKVPAISNKHASIPSDEYSWRKYGQKPIKGSPYPRYFIIIHQSPFRYLRAQPHPIANSACPDVTTLKEISSSVMLPLAKILHATFLFGVTTPHAKGRDTSCTKFQHLLPRNFVKLRMENESGSGVLWFCIPLHLGELDNMDKMLMQIELTVIAGDQES